MLLLMETENRFLTLLYYQHCEKLNRIHFFIFLEDNFWTLNFSIIVAGKSHHFVVLVDVGGSEVDEDVDDEHDVHN